MVGGLRERWAEEERAERLGGTGSEGQKFRSDTHKWEGCQDFMREGRKKGKQGGKQEGRARHEGRQTGKAGKQRASMRKHRLIKVHICSAEKTATQLMVMREAKFNKEKATAGIEERG